MLALVTGTISLGSCPPKLLERLRYELSFPNPEYIKRKRLGKYAGFLPEKIECLIEHSNGQIEIPRGAVDILKRAAADYQILVKFKDCRVSLPKAGLQADIGLRPYQARAVQQMERRTQGLVVIPPGGGKTVVSLAAIAAIDQPSLIIVHTKDLLEQWANSVERFLGIKPGIISEGRAHVSTVTVATIQTLQNCLESNDLTKRFGCLIVDECHHIGASIFQSVVPRFPARFRFGVTATPYREDGLTKLIGLAVGRKIFEISHNELVANGYLQTAEIRPVFTEFKFNYKDADDFQKCLTTLVNDSVRNSLIADLASNEAVSGHTVLVLTNRIVHCRILVDLIRKRHVHAEALIGTLKKSTRKQILADFRAGKLPVVVASTLADEGLDVPVLSRIVLAFPCKAKGRTIQRLGRLMRPQPDKPNGILYDLVDANVEPLVRQYRKRRAAYSSLSKRRTP